MAACHTQLYVAGKQSIMHLNFMNEKIAKSFRDTVQSQLQLQLGET